MMAGEDLRRIPFFSRFSPDELAQVSSLLVERTYQPGEILFVQDDPAPGLFFVRSGRVRVFRVSPSGAEQTLCLMHAHMCFGICPLFDGSLAPATAQALDQVLLYILPTHAVQDLARQSGEAAQALLKLFAERTRHLASLAERLALLRLRGRLARYLLEQAAERGQRAAEGVEFPLETSKTILASLLGVSPETLSRSLGRLEALGILQIRGRQALIKNERKLTEIAQKV